MAEIHITEIQYVELNAEEGLEFKYKPEVPKLKLGITPPPKEKK